MIERFAIVLAILPLVACSTPATNDFTVSRIAGESVEYAQFCDVALGGEAVTAAEFALDKKLTVECHDAMVDPQMDHQVFVGAQMESVQKAPSASTAPPEGAMGRWYDLVCIGGLCRLEIDAPVELGIGQRAVIVFDGFDWGDASTSLSWDLPNKKPTKEIPDSQLCLNLLGDPDVEYAAIKQDKADGKHLDADKFGCAIDGHAQKCNEVAKAERDWEELLVYYEGYKPIFLTEQYGLSCGNSFVDAIQAAVSSSWVYGDSYDPVAITLRSIDEDNVVIPNVTYELGIANWEASSRGGVEWKPVSSWSDDHLAEAYFYGGSVPATDTVTVGLLDLESGPVTTVEITVKAFPDCNCWD